MPYVYKELLNSAHWTDYIIMDSWHTDLADDQNYCHRLVGDDFSA